MKKLKFRIYLTHPVDPLLRNLNKNRRVQEVRLLRKNATNEEINFKGAAYADDIS